MSILSLPSGVADSAASILSRHTGLCPLRVRPPISMAVHAAQPGVNPCFSKSAGSSLALRPLIPGSTVGGAGRSSSASGGANTGARRSSGGIPCVGLSGVPAIRNWSSMHHLSSSGLRLIDRAFTTPLGVPTRTSVDRISMPIHTPSSYRGSGACTGCDFLSSGR